MRGTRAQGRVVRSGIEEGGEEEKKRKKKQTSYRRDVKTGETRAEGEKHVYNKVCV